VYNTDLMRQLCREITAEKDPHHAEELIPNAPDSGLSPLPYTRLRSAAEIEAGSVFLDGCAPRDNERRIAARLVAENAPQRE
jgi:hypothetical protein